jgi:hypothetical protein
VIDTLFPLRLLIMTRLPIAYNPVIL